MVDRHRRRQAIDGVEVGLIHLPQELTGIARQAFHVAALTLGVDGIERKARLARTGKAGDDHELIARNGDIDVLEIMLSRATDNDGRIGHVSSSSYDR